MFNIVMLNNMIWHCLCSSTGASFFVWWHQVLLTGKARSNAEPCLDQKVYWWGRSKVRLKTNNSLSLFTMKNFTGNNSKSPWELFHKLLESALNNEDEHLIWMLHALLWWNLHSDVHCFLCIENLRLILLILCGIEPNLCLAVPPGKNF